MIQNCEGIEGRVEEAKARTYQRLVRSYRYSNKLTTLAKFSIREQKAANSNRKAGTQYSKTEDKRRDYSTPGTVEKSLLYFIYYIYNGLYNYSYIYRSNL